MRNITLLICLILFVGGTVSAEYNVPSEMQWWYQARFGMFIHFGSYSSLGHGEWAFYNEWWSKYDYQTQVSEGFNPRRYSASTIVGLAKDAGMKYIVITAKHHEGYAMWNSNVPGFTDTTGNTEYNLYDYSGVNKDILGDLKAACDAEGIKLCLYYSIIDWSHYSQDINHNTMFTNMNMSEKDAYVADMKAQLAELITAFDPAILWFDGDWCADLGNPTSEDWWNSQDGQNLYNYVKGLSPNIIVNERVKRDQGLGDYAVAEFGVPAAPMSRPWEKCETMNGAWGYDTAFENDYKSSTELIREMVTVVSRDGNFLLNIGPKGDGNVPQGAKSILQSFAGWMSTYQDSIYGTIGSPYSSEPYWGKFTAKDGALYAHVFIWPPTGQLSVPKLTNTITRIYSMDNPTVDLSYTVSGTSINISVPGSAPDSTDSVIAIEVVGMPDAAPGSEVVFPNGRYMLTPVHSGQQLVIPQGSTANGAYVIQWPDDGGAEFDWDISSVGNGFYKVLNHNSGKALGIEGVSQNDGARALQWDYVGNTDQHWQIANVGGDDWILIAGHSGKALSIENGSMTAGAYAVQETYTGQDYQTFNVPGTGGGTGGNNPPSFTSDPIVEVNGTQGQSYSSTISDDASDPDSDPLTFSKVSGPAWLNVASNGSLSGTPGAGDVGLNSFTVEVNDGNGGTDQATLEITVNPAGPATSLHVSAIVTQTASAGQGYKYGQALVTIVDNNGTPVSGATVTGTFSGSYNETQSGVTDSSGIATITTTATVKGGVSFTFCVDDVVGSLPYSSGDNVVTCN